MELYTTLVEGATSPLRIIQERIINIGEGIPGSRREKDWSRLLLATVLSTQAVHRAAFTTLLGHKRHKVQIRSSILKSRRE